jgi:hypothetical protein
MLVHEVTGVVRIQSANTFEAAGRDKPQSRMRNGTAPNIWVTPLSLSRSRYSKSCCSLADVSSPASGVLLSDSQPLVNSFSPLSVVRITRALARPGGPLYLLTICFCH